MTAREDKLDAVAAELLDDRYLDTTSGRTLPCTCNAPEGSTFPHQHATLCPRFAGRTLSQADEGLVREGRPYKASPRPCVVCGRMISVPVIVDRRPPVWACVLTCTKAASTSQVIP